MSNHYSGLPSVGFWFFGLWPGRLVSTGLAGDY